MKYKVTHDGSPVSALAAAPELDIEADTFEQACRKTLELLGYRVEGPISHDMTLNRPVGVD